jgi:hypothetical protein
MASISHQVALKSHHGTYLHYSGNTCKAVAHGEDKETFIMGYVRHVVLDSQRMYDETVVVTICSHAFGDKMLTCTRGGDLEWHDTRETSDQHWLLVDDPNGNFIRSSHGYNLTCTPDGEVKTSRNAQAWEVWQVEYLPR